ncbi:BTAD domain-containing putative transcriptional regulator [Streptomyces monticola]|uniref:BTAD domain-containing putative transcriptional regulator n=1 Tax=Streptomyces monticola TaxID=2666263 RepID=A0ABW2JSU7_9ACTN
MRRTGTQYGIDSVLVRVDLWEFRAAVDAARQQPTDRVEKSAALERVVALYTGDFAEDIDAVWTVAPREALRREYLDALSALVRLSSGADPRHMLDLLERARELDRHNEAIYRDIARIQAQLGQHDAVIRTFQLLERALAELDTKPGRETVALFDALRSPSAGRRSASEDMG